MNEWILWSTKNIIKVNIRYSKFEIGERNAMLKRRMSNIERESEWERCIPTGHYFCYWHLINSGCNSLLIALHHRISNTQHIQSGIRESWNLSKEFFVFFLSLSVEMKLNEIPNRLKWYVLGLLILFYFIPIFIHIKDKIIILF